MNGSRSARWVEEYIPDNAQMWGNGIAIEWRYVANIMQGAQNDGLRCEVN